MKKENYKAVLNKLDEKQSLQSVQKIREEMWRELGFDDETAQETVLLLMEEVGELAKALRKQSGIKCDESKNNYSSVGEEAADVFNLLLDLCTIQGIDLYEAFRDKNTAHMDRVWKKAEK
jgi:NTP pyrophosphatase (non-canonical NTP hydrolase)